MDPWLAILVLLRWCHLLVLASLFGTLVSLALVAPAGLNGAGATATWARDRLVSLAKWSDGAALLIGVAWTVLQAASMASATSFGGTLSALMTVLSTTRFGHLVLLRFGLLLAAFPLLGRRDWRLAAALTLAGMALAMQGAMGHAGAAGGMAGASLLLLEALHLLAAGAWLGGLLPLFLLVGSLPPQPASLACQSFSTVGLIAVLLIAGTALAQSWQWIGNLGG
jgi:copper resistance protein D